MRQYSAIFAMSLLLIMTFYLYWDVAIGLFYFWLDEGNYTYSHGWLLLLVCVYLVYERWREFPQFPALNPSCVGGVVAALSSVAWLMATLGSIQVVQFLAFVGLVGSLFIGVMGVTQARVFLFPVLLILGALPLWDWVATMLQMPTALVAEWMLKISMVPVLREGFFLNVPAGVFEVAPSCSGLHYILVAVLLGLIFGAMNRLRWWATLFIAVVAGCIGIVANFIRVYSVILIGQYTNMTSDLVEDHASVGWVIFSIGAVPLFLLASKYSRQDKYVSRHKVVAVVAKRGYISSLPGIGCILLGLLVGPLWLAYLDRNVVHTESTGWILPDSIDKAKHDRMVGDYEPGFMAGDEVNEGWFYLKENGNSDIYYYISRYYRQSQGKEAVSNANHLVAQTSSWRQLEISVRTLPDVMGKVNVSTLISGDDKLRVWQWYQVGDRRIASPFWAKIYNVLDSLRGNTVVDVVVLATDGDDQVIADAMLYQFIEQF